MGLRRSSWAPLIAALAVTFAAVTLADQAAAGSGLVTRTSKAAGFTVSLPAAWHYENASYPSDHSTEYWTNPADLRSRLEVSVSGCVGCVEPPSCVLDGTGCGPDPEAVVPREAISRRKLGRWSAEFVARAPGSPYLEHGIVVIRHAGGKAGEWAYLELWLPPSEGRLAGSVLGSFRFH